MILLESFITGDWPSITEMIGCAKEPIIDAGVHSFEAL